MDVKTVIKGMIQLHILVPLTFPQLSYLNHKLTLKMFSLVDNNHIQANPGKDHICSI